MDFFLNLPDNVVYQMCEEMDTKSLSRLTESSSRVYQLCNTILNKRLQKRKEEDLIPLSSNVTSWTENPDNKGLYEIIIEKGEVMIDVLYSILDNNGLYVEFMTQDEDNRIAIGMTIHNDKILDFIRFLETLLDKNHIKSNIKDSIKSNIKVFNDISFIINRKNNSIIIKESNETDSYFMLYYTYENFASILNELIEFIRRRYYNLKLGIVSKPKPQNI